MTPQARQPQLPADHRAVIEGIAGDAYDGAANDNRPSGAAAHSWPAMRLNAGNEVNRRLLVMLSHLFELASAPPDDLPSPAGAYKSDGEMALSDLLDEVTANDDGMAGNPGYGVDCRMREGTDLEKLIKAGVFQTKTTVLPDGRAGATRLVNKNFRVIHSWDEILVGGEIVPIKFVSRAEYKLPYEWKKVRGEMRKVKSKWRPVRGERFTEPRGPDRDDSDFELSSTAVKPSGNVGATAVPYGADDPLDARIILEQLRAAIGDDNFKVLRLAVVERKTARAIGESMSKKYNAASSLGTALIRDALRAANDNLASIAKAA